MALVEWDRSRAAKIIATSAACSGRDKPRDEQQQQRNNGADKSPTHTIRTHWPGAPAAERKFASAKVARKLIKKTRALHLEGGGQSGGGGNKLRRDQVGRREKVKQTDWPLERLSLCHFCATERPPALMARSSRGAKCLFGAFSNEQAGGRRELRPRTGVSARASLADDGAAATP